MSLILAALAVGLGVGAVLAAARPLTAGVRMGVDWVADRVLYAGQHRADEVPQLALTAAPALGDDLVAAGLMTVYAGPRSRLRLLCHVLRLQVR